LERLEQKTERFGLVSVSDRNVSFISLSNSLRLQ